MSKDNSMCTEHWIAIQKLEKWKICFCKNIPKMPMLVFSSYTNNTHTVNGFLHVIVQIWRDLHSPSITM